MYDNIEEAESKEEAGAPELTKGREMNYWRSVTEIGKEENGEIIKHTTLQYRRIA